jgi:hypothetical protein
VTVTAAGDCSFIDAYGTRTFMRNYERNEFRSPDSRALRLPRLNSTLKLTAPGFGPALKRLTPTALG